MRFETLVPTFRAIARSVVGEALSDEIALAVDHHLYRNTSEYGRHLVAWGAYLTMSDALDRVANGTPSALSAERLAALNELPAAALTVVALRDGAGFSFDAIAVAVERPVSEVRWLAALLEAPADAPSQPQPIELAIPAPAPAEATEPPPWHPPDVPNARPKAKIFAPLLSPDRAPLLIVSVAVLVVALVVGAAGLIGNDGNDRQRQRQADRAQNAPLGEVIASPAGPQLSTAACSSAQTTEPFGQIEIELSTAAPASASMSAPQPFDGPRPLVLALSDPGADFSSGAGMSGLIGIAQSNGALVATIAPADGHRWATPISAELTPDIDVLAQVLSAIGAAVCVDPTRVSVAASTGAADFATSVVCNYPTLASHLIAVGQHLLPEGCARFTGRAMLSVIDGSEPDSHAALEAVGSLAAQRHCQEATQEPGDQLAVAVSTGCDTQAQIWLAVTAEQIVATPGVTELVDRFMNNAGALVSP